MNLRDFQLLAEIPQHSSLRSLSRALKVNPQHLSKLIAALEKKCGASLMHRSPKGISITPEAIRFVELGAELMARLQEFSKESPQETKKKTKPLTLVSRVFLNVCFCPSFTQLMNREFPHHRLRFVDASPKKKEQWAREGVIDLVLSLDRLDLGRAWHEEHLGEMAWSFYGRTAHPLGKGPKKENLLTYPLVAHSHIDGVRLVESTQGHPYKFQFKKLSSSTETALATIRIVEHTDAVAFLPDFLAQEVAPLTLQRFEISGLHSHREPVFLYAHLDRVPSQVYKMMVLEAKNVLRGRS